jgi:hypothetical protein
MVINFPQDRKRFSKKRKKWSFKHLHSKKARRKEKMNNSMLGYTLPSNHFELKMPTLSLKFIIPAVLIALGIILTILNDLMNKPLTYIGTNGLRHIVTYLEIRLFCIFLGPIGWGMYFSYFAKVKIFPSIKKKILRWLIVGGFFLALILTIIKNYDNTLFFYQNSFINKESYFSVVDDFNILIACKKDLREEKTEPININNYSIEKKTANFASGRQLYTNVIYILSVSGEYGDRSITISPYDQNNISKILNSSNQKQVIYIYKNSGFLAMNLDE